MHEISENRRRRNAVATPQRFRNYVYEFARVPFRSDVADVDADWKSTQSLSESQSRAAFRAIRKCLFLFEIPERTTNTQSNSQQLSAARL